jgi:hypothetical protein
LGYANVDDRGFLVRKNNNPATDVQWLPGQPEPGDLGWNWDTYYGVFASSYTRDGWIGNEVYEVAWHNTGNISGEPPLDPCYTIILGISDPKNGEPSQPPQLVWQGNLHIGTIVGGVIELPMVEEPGAVTPDSSGHNYGASAGIIVGAIVGTIALISAAWYVRRRRTKAI